MRPHFPQDRQFRPIRRRQVLAIIAAGLAGLAAPVFLRARQTLRTIAIGLTPAVLSDDLELLSTSKSYLETTIGRSVQLVLRKTYQEITAVLVSGQLDAAWICGYPYVAFRDRLEVVPAPIWRGNPLYQSYLITRKDNPATSLDDLNAGVTHSPTQIAILVIS